MGRHVIGRLRGPDGHVSEPSLSRVPILGFWRAVVQLQVHTKAFAGTPVGLIERLIRNFQQASPPLSHGVPPGGDDYSTLSRCP